MSNLQILVLTSCTGEKQYKPSEQLTRADFQQIDSQAFFNREAELDAYRMVAEEMYTGQQHLRLMDGIEELRASGATVDLYILSAGYGIIEGQKEIVPYECSFQTMNATEINNWSRHLNIPEHARKLFLRTDYDLMLVLLGDSYLRALQLGDDVRYGSPTLFLCANKSERFIKGTGDYYIQSLGTWEAKRFHCGLVGLKGEIARRLFHSLTDYSEPPEELMLEQRLDLLDQPQLEPKHKFGPVMQPLLSVNYKVELPEDWKPRQKAKKVQYFIPDWDDTVDPDYHFEDEQHSGGIGNWSNQVYAHQLYEAPNYDGLLLSRAVIEKSATKRATIYAHKVHPYLRVPMAFPVMGDSGAFSYIGQDTPPYETHEMLDYYTDLGFDYGVSIDHLWFGAETQQEQQQRYDLTIYNAEAFLNEHRKRGLTWTPIGAVQGWDADTYVRAAHQLVLMGYEYIGLGGLVRTNSKDIIRIIQAVRDVIPAHIKLHIFGVARTDAIPYYQQLRVTSADSASALRKAWTDVTRGYYAETEVYAALRIPYVESIIRKLQRSGQNVDVIGLRQLETDALQAVRAVAHSKKNPEIALSALLAYEDAVRPSGRKMDEHYRHTLTERPWEKCDCAICQDIGIEAIIFRGNNRNRRRGFHNTYIFYKLMQKLLAGESVSKTWMPNGKLPIQLALPTHNLPDVSQI